MKEGNNSKTKHTILRYTHISQFKPPMLNDDVCVECQQRNKHTNTHTHTQNIHTELKLRTPFLRSNVLFSIFLSLLV